MFTLILMIVGLVVQIIIYCDINQQFNKNKKLNEKLKRDT